ncbi:carbon-nitrogen hydrolase family protein [Pseudarthrobacter sp. NamB4]|uniref:carbon-nitrogen hydrolase family protein n=1 Tax=Pseudarthrobacter sp. NamB4 TaxID=2576837 RepID=UPI0010FF37A9|nr:carbon-nitrogen hydrolase family protein [Pseudarthrobacter sp. NamB4]TLM73287.1 carbon-nitrogen hydrolase family protein [Pseudarthrobacter sp. NamB4]
MAVLLALLQANSTVLDVDANCQAIEAAARSAASRGAAVLLTPELFPVGYAPRRVRSEFDPTRLPALQDRLAGIASSNGIGLVYSLPRLTEQGEWQISATLLDAGGNTLLTYGKVHLFGSEERDAFTPATDPPAVVDFNGIPTSIVICYDVEFPEPVRAAAVRGAELLLVPTALADGFDDVPQVLLRARALESQLTVAYANHCGHEEGCRFLGGSVIAGPDGGVLAEADGEPGLLFAEVDPAAAGRERRTVPYLAERRPDLYRSWGF